MTKFLITVRDMALDLLFPRHCILCDCISKESLCKTCRPKIQYLSGNRCKRCSKPLNEEGDYCRDCGMTRHEYINGMAVLGYEDMADSIFRFKYTKRAEYAKGYASLIYAELKDWFDYIKPDAFIPVPLHPKREIKRGYNQALELSKELSTLTDIPTRSDVVFRVKNTLPQKNNDRRQRQNNMKKAFIVRGNDVKLEIVVIIDDIYTTGSTIDAIARELKGMGVQKVYFVTLAIAGA